MVQKYQNEISPTIYYGISTKNNEKDLKIPNLQALTLGHIIKMTLYNHSLNQRHQNKAKKGTQYTNLLPTKEGYSEMIMLITDKSK